MLDINALPVGKKSLEQILTEDKSDKEYYVQHKQSLCDTLARRKGKKRIKKKLISKRLKNKKGKRVKKK